MMLRRKKKSLKEQGEKRMTLKEKLEEIDNMSFDDLRGYLGISRFEAEAENYDRISLLEMARDLAEEEGDDE
jgi:hypothetical protein